MANKIMVYRVAFTRQGSPYLNKGLCANNKLDEVLNHPDFPAYLTANEAIASFATQCKEWAEEARSWLT